MKYPRILTVQDLSCLGQCSLTVALPVLSACGAETCVLPTALLSTHTGGLGRPHIRDLTGDLAPIAAHWREQGMTFDLICTGYLGSAAQMEQVAAVLDDLAAPGCIRIIDPAMADHGRLYAGFDGAFVKAMRAFCGRGDWLLPNLTEACLLTGTEYRTDYDRPWAEELLEKLSRLGCGNIVLTGVFFQADTTGVLVWEQGRGAYYGHERLSQSCHGTGDLFAAAFAGALSRGKTAGQAARIAADFTLSCMKLTLRENTRPYGVMFEPLLPELAAALSDRSPLADGGKS